MLVPASRPGDAVARFCAERIETIAATEAGVKTRRRLGPLTLDVMADNSAFEARLFRAVVGKPSEQAADFQLHIATRSDGALGSPPATWPFALDDRASFHRTHWSPTDGTALTSDEQAGVWNIMADHGARALTWIADVESLPSWEYATPLRHHVHWQALRRQALVVHSAAVECDGGCFLLTGPGGSGKSTTTVAALAAGRRILAEDLCWVDLSDARVDAHPLYSSVKLTDNARARFPFVERFVADHDHASYDKTLVYLDEPAGGWGAPSAVRAMFCLSGRFDSRTRIEPCGKGEAFRLLAPSTLFLMRTSSAELLPRLRLLIDRLPTYHVTLGADPVEAVETMAAFVGRSA